MQSRTFLKKSVVWVLLVGLVLGRPAAVWAETITPEPTPTPAPTEEPTPTPTLTWRQQYEQDQQELLNSYYQRYGITPRPQRGNPDGSAETTEVAESTELVTAATVVPSPTPPAVSSPTENQEESETAEAAPVEAQSGIGLTAPEGTDNDGSGATNENTGAGSHNETSASNEQETTLKNENITTQTDTFNQTAETGFNAAGSIIGNTSLKTGDANLSLAENNNFNSNVSGVPNSNADDGIINQSDNQNTGSNSENIAAAETSQTTTIENTNILDLEQTGVLDANSGYNLTESIIGDSTIETGEVNISLNQINFANSNVNANAKIDQQNFDVYETQVDDIILNFESSNASAGDLAGSDNDFETADQQALAEVSAKNQNTQSGSFNQASGTQTKTFTTQNTNQAEVNQDYQINANTGGNVADGNTGTTTIETGNVNIVANIVNFVNANLNNVSNFVIGTVNIFGEMLGNVVLQDNSSFTAKSAGLPKVSQTSAENSNTGSNTTNIATVTQEEITQITNTNEMSVDNEIALNLTTGGNEVEAINGNVKVKTGQVKSNVQTNTIGNINATSNDGTDEETFWLVITNNLGEWTGKIFGFEGQNYAVVDGYQLLQQENLQLTSTNENTLGDLNVAESKKSVTTQIENKNEAKIETSLTINASTGTNLVESNNGPVEVKTGDIKASANITNLANFNFNGKKLMIAVVNIFGKFLGNVLTPGAQAPVSDSEAIAATAQAALPSPTVPLPTLPPSGAQEPTPTVTPTPTVPLPTAPLPTLPPVLAQASSPTPPAPTKKPETPKGGPAEISGSTVSVAAGPEGQNMQANTQNSYEEGGKDQEETQDFEAPEINQITEAASEDESEPILPLSPPPGAQEPVSEIASAMAQIAFPTPTPSLATPTPKATGPAPVLVFSSTNQEKNLPLAGLMFLIAIPPTAWVGRKFLQA